MDYLKILKIISGFSLGLFLLKSYFNSPKSPIKCRMDGKIILITGASAGIGKETAIELLDQGARVILASRSKEKSLNVINKSKYKQNGSFYTLDLSSYDSIKAFADTIKKDFPEGIDILINNAGQAFSSPELTENKIEKTIQTNHIGHVILTGLLIKLIKPNGKIINVSSRGHIRAEKKLIESIENDLSFSNISSYYQIIKMYGYTKLCNIVYTKFLAKYYPNLKSVSLHPGVVYTDIWDKTEGIFNFLVNLLKPILFIFMKNEKIGAQTTLYLAYQDYDKLKNGGYYKDCAEYPSAGLSNDELTNKKIMIHTKNIIEKYFNEIPQDLSEHLQIIEKINI